MNQQRMLKQIEFIIEIDKLKSIYRQTLIIDKSRNENDAEHTWHLMIMAVILLEHANKPDLDILRVLKMLMIHDLVEIDAGDTFAYDEKGYEDKYEREDRAAKRIFGLLPEDQRDEFYQLWQEFEERKTPEAQYAGAIDRLQPMLHNYYTEGFAWQIHGVTSEQVLTRNKGIEVGSKDLSRFAENLIHEAISKGYLCKSLE